MNENKKSILNNEITNTPKKRGRKKKETNLVVQTEINNIMIEEDVINNNVSKDKKKSVNKSQVDNIINNNVSKDKKKSVNKSKVDNIINNKTDTIENKNDTSDDNNNNNFLKEMLTKQLKNVNSSKKLSYSDIKRISKFLNVSIFDEEKCSLWTGYITNEKNQSKGTYINFYFNKKKIALHRLLFLNYIGEISNEEYIKFSCENKGKCCNINHMKKYSYNKKNDENDEANNNENKKNESSVKNDSKLHINTDKKKLIVEF